MWRIKMCLLHKNISVAHDTQCAIEIWLFMWHISTRCATKMPLSVAHMQHAPQKFSFLWIMWDNCHKSQKNSKIKSKNHKIFEKKTFFSYKNSQKSKKYQQFKIKLCFIFLKILNILLFLYFFCRKLSSFFIL